jgi:hypothetical protein
VPRVGHAPIRPRGTDLTGVNRSIERANEGTLLIDETFTGRLDKAFPHLLATGIRVRTTQIRQATHYDQFQTGGRLSKKASIASRESAYVRNRPE